MTSPTVVHAKTKAHVAGAVKVQVTTAGGTATSGTSHEFTFIASAPSISSFTPTSGTTSGGTTVTITGTNLIGATAVQFGTTPATSFTVTSPTTLKAVTGAHVAGTVTIKITTAGGTVTASSDYRYVAPTPTITSLTPTSGTTSGGTTVTITGTGFIGATAVHFGATTAASFTVTSPTVVHAKTKAHVAGAVKVQVTTAGGTATSGTSHEFTFIAPTPTITSLTPTSGTTSGGTTVTITGTGFIGATAVHFGATTAASFTVTSPTVVHAKTKAHVAGAVKVQVTTAGGTATSGTADTYTFSRLGSEHLLVHTDVGDHQRRDHSHHHRHEPDRGHRRPVRHNTGDELHRDIAHHPQGGHRGPCGRHSDDQDHHGRGDRHRLERLPAMWRPPPPSPR